MLIVPARSSWSKKNVAVFVRDNNVQCRRQCTRRKSHVSLWLESVLVLTPTVRCTRSARRSYSMWKDFWKQHFQCNEVHKLLRSSSNTFRCSSGMQLTREAVHRSAKPRNILYLFSVLIDRRLNNHTTIEFHHKGSQVAKWQCCVYETCWAFVSLIQVLQQLWPSDAGELFWSLRWLVITAT